MASDSLVLSSEIHAVDRKLEELINKHNRTLEALEARFKPIEEYINQQKENEKQRLNKEQADLRTEVAALQKLRDDLKADSVIRDLKKEGTDGDNRTAK